jgi:hypothetical protein
MIQATAFESADERRQTRYAFPDRLGRGSARRGSSAFIRVFHLRSSAFPLFPGDAGGGQIFPACFSRESVSAERLR